MHDSKTTILVLDRMRRYSTTRKAYRGQQDTVGENRIVVKSCQKIDCCRERRHSVRDT